MLVRTEINFVDKFPNLKKQNEKRRILLVDDIIQHYHFEIGLFIISIYITGNLRMSRFTNSISTWKMNGFTINISYSFCK